MQAVARIAVSMFLVSSAFAAVYQTSAKLRRDGIMNLYPFPRVGRSHHTWQVPLNDFYLEYKPAEKRQLYAFPRVGRGEPRDRAGQLLREEPRRPGPKRESENTDTTGMWFGPRLGRGYRSEEDTYPAIGDNRGPEHTDQDFAEEREKRQA